MDDLIREWEHLWQLGDYNGLRNLIADLVRRGELLKALILLLANRARLGGMFKEFLRLFPELRKLLALYKELATLITELEEGAMGPWDILGLGKRKENIGEVVSKIAKLRRLGLLVETTETFSAIATPLLEVLLLLLAGIVLPASKMGELSIELPGSKVFRTAYDTLTAAYHEHFRQRDDYTHSPNWTKLRELMNSASALSNDISHFLHQHPGDRHKSDVQSIQRQVEEWIEQYFNGIGPTAPVQPSPTVSPPSSPAMPQVSMPVPPTIANPPTLEWLEGEDIRRSIQLHKKWIRKWKKKLGEAKPWEREYKENLQKAIDGELDAIEKLREKAQTLDQDTGEDWDEPLEDPPAPPFDPRTVTYIDPIGEYINTKTGEKQVFTVGNPPPSEDWVQIKFDPATGQWNVHWGWVPQDDPASGKRTWRPGWLLVN